MPSGLKPVTAMVAPPFLRPPRLLQLRQSSGSGQQAQEATAAGIVSALSQAGSPASGQPQASPGVSHSQGEQARPNGCQRQLKRLLRNYAEHRLPVPAT